MITKNKISTLPIAVFCDGDLQVTVGLARKVWLFSSQGYPQLGDWIILVSWSCLFYFFGYDKTSSAHSSNEFPRKCSKNGKFDLFHWVKIPPKWVKSTDHDQNVSSWKCSQDTSACQISSHSSHAFWKNRQKPLIWRVSLSQNDENQQTTAKI